MVVWVVAGLTVCVVMAAVVAVLVTVMAVCIVLQEVGVDVQFGIQVEALQVKHFGNRHFPEMHALLGCARIHVLDAVGQGICFVFGDQIGFADENLVGKTHLAACFLALVELLFTVLGIDQGQDGVEQVKLGNLVVHEEGLRDRAWIGQAGGFDHHAFEIQGACLALLGQVGQGLAQIFPDGATDAAIAHLNNVLLGVGHQNVVVDVFFAEFVLDHSNALAVGFGEDAFEQRGLAAAQKTGEDGDRNQAHERSVVLTPRMQGQ